jgi:hypothetical protein
MMASRPRKQTQKSRKQKLAKLALAQIQAEELRDVRATQKRKNELIGEVVSHLTELNLIDAGTIERGLDFYLISKVDRDLFALSPRNNPQI